MARKSPPGFLSVLEPRPSAERLLLPRSGGEPLRSSDHETPGRPGRWLTRPDHPLTARVLVNRLWQHHFGRGIVATPERFRLAGRAGHPSRAARLAGHRVRRPRLEPEGDAPPDGHVRHLSPIVPDGIRRTGAARKTANPQTVDPENRLLWRMNRRRLEGETARDAMLAVSGRLNARAGGPSVFPELPRELKAGKQLASVGGCGRARPPQRLRLRPAQPALPVLQHLRRAGRTETCARRYVTTTAPQALMLLERHPDSGAGAGLRRPRVPRCGSRTRLGR